MTALYIGSGHLLARRHGQFASLGIDADTLEGGDGPPALAAGRGLDLEAHLDLAAQDVVQGLGYNPGKALLQPLLGEIARYRDHHRSVPDLRNRCSPEPGLKAGPG